MTRTAAAPDHTVHVQRSGELGVSARKLVRGGARCAGLAPCATERPWRRSCLAGGAKLGRLKHNEEPFYFRARIEYSGSARGISLTKQNLVASTRVHTRLPIGIRTTILIADVQSSQNAQKTAQKYQSKFCASIPQGVRGGISYAVQRGPRHERSKLPEAGQPSGLPAQLDRCRVGGLKEPSKVFARSRVKPSVG